MFKQQYTEPPSEPIFVTDKFFTHCSGELDANRPVPFRLTPPLQSFVTQIGITGPFQLSILAAARCLVQPHHALENILKAILRDQFIAWKKVQ